MVHFGAEFLKLRPIFGTKFSNYYPGYDTVF